MGEMAMVDAAAAYRRNGWWRDETFLGDLRRNAASQPAKPAIVAYRDHSARNSVISYGELARLTGSFAAALRNLGVERGDVVAVQLPNWWDLLPLGLACAQAGARFCPLMTIYRQYELRHILRLTGARVCVTVSEWDGCRLADIVAGLAGELPQLKHVLVADTGTGTGRPAGTLAYADHFAGAPLAAGGDYPAASQAGPPGGEASQPAGQASQPAGQASQPAGQASQPAGDASQPLGQASQPPGDASQLAGDASQLAGDASQLAGEAGPLGGPAGGAELGPDEPFLILFTSGTTGEAKGVMHSQNTLYAGSRGYAAALGIDSSVVTFVSHSATHFTGFVQGMLIPVMLGGTALVQDVWDADEYLDIGQRHGVTTFYGAPHFLSQLIAAQRARPRDVSSLRTVVTGSAPVPPHIVEQVRDVLGADVVALWGMTENGCVTITRRDDPPGWAACSDGRPIDGMQVRIDTSAVPGGEAGPGQPGGEAGSGQPGSGQGGGEAASVQPGTVQPGPVQPGPDELGSGQLGSGQARSGKLWVRGANQCLGYFNRPQAYAESFDGDGWFDTGDLARDDGRGGIRLTGRAKDIVIRLGLNVPVTEVEGILARHPQVREAAVIGLPDPDGDELVCAVVVPADEPPSLEALHKHMAAAGVNEWCWPGRLEIVPELPKTVTGKVRKVDLRQRFGRG